MILDPLCEHATEEITPLPPVFKPGSPRAGLSRLLNQGPVMLRRRLRILLLRVLVEGLLLRSRSTPTNTSGATSTAHRPLRSPRVLRAVNSGSMPTTWALEQNIVLFNIDDARCNLADDVKKVCARCQINCEGIGVRISLCRESYRETPCCCSRWSVHFSGEWAKRSAAQKKLLCISYEVFFARAKRGKVFSGKTFYVTPKVQVDMQLNVIVSCGA